LGLQKI